MLYFWWWNDKILLWSLTMRKQRKKNECENERDGMEGNEICWRLTLFGGWFVIGIVSVLRLFGRVTCDWWVGWERLWRDVCGTCACWTTATTAATTIASTSNIVAVVKGILSSGVVMVIVADDAGTVVDTAAVNVVGVGRRCWWRVVDDQWSSRGERGAARGGCTGCAKSGNLGKCWSWGGAYIKIIWRVKMINY